MPSLSGMWLLFADLCSMASMHAQHRACSPPDRARHLALHRSQRFSHPRAPSRLRPAMHAAAETQSVKTEQLAYTLSADFTAFSLPSAPASPTAGAGNCLCLLADFWQATRVRQSA